MIDTSIEIDGTRVIITIVADNEEEAAAIARTVMARLKQESLEAAVAAAKPEEKPDGL